MLKIIFGGNNSLLFESLDGKLLDITLPWS
jgi:hypothetical protein